MLGSQDVKKLQQDIALQPESAKPEAPQTPVTPTISNDMIPTDVAISKVAELFGVMHHEIGKYSPELNKIVEYAKQMGAKTMDDFMYQVRALSDSLANNMQEKKLKTVYRYLYLLADKQKIEQDIERMKQ